MENQKIRDIKVPIGTWNRIIQILQQLPFIQVVGLLEEIQKTVQQEDKD